MRYGLFMLVMVALSGCKTHIQVTLYTSDIIAIMEADDDAPKVTPIVIQTEVPSKKWCRERLGKVAAPAIKALVGQMYLKSCEDRGFKTIATLKGKSPIILNDEEGPKKFAVALTENQGDTLIGLSLPRETSAKIRRLLPALASGETQDVSFSIRIISDSEKEFFVFARDVFMDGVPVSQKIKKLPLPRRSETVISLSNVRNATILEFGGNGIAYVNWE